MQKIKISGVFVLLFLFPTLLFAQIDSVKNDSTKKVNFAFIPVVNYNNSMGIIVGGMGAAFYKLNANDTISPSSSSMALGIYTGNKSFLGLVVQKFYFNEDKWRAKMIGGSGAFFFQYLQGLPGGNSGRFNENGIWIDFDTKATFGLAELQRQVFSHFYAGFEFVASHAVTTYVIPTGENKPQDTADLNSLGYTLQYDNRDNVNFPVEGIFTTFKNRFIRDWLGATENYNNYELTFNYFWDIKNNNKSILVSRFYSNIASGDVPFQGQNVIGGDDLRGYSKGEFRGNQIYAVQAELRQNIYKKFGMVGFLGIGSAVNEISEIPDKDILPSIGLGIRYLMIAKEKINIGVDVGVGKDDWSLTFRIGEAFSR